MIDHRQEEAATNFPKGEYVQIQDGDDNKNGKTLGSSKTEPPSVPVGEAATSTVEAALPPPPPSPPSQTLPSSPPPPQNVNAEKMHAVSATAGTSGRDHENMENTPEAATRKAVKESTHTSE